MLQYDPTNHKMDAFKITQSFSASKPSEMTYSSGGQCLTESDFSCNLDVSMSVDTPIFTLTSTKVSAS